MHPPDQLEHGNGLVKRADESVGLVTGFTAFAGLPSNPAEELLPALDGLVLAGARITVATLPVSRGAVMGRITELLKVHQPDFVLCLGLAFGAPVIQVETVAINAARFVVADNDGHRPSPGEPVDPTGPPARLATWNAEAVVEALHAAEIPAAISFHAGTHLCNMALYAMLAALDTRGRGAPCGFLHLPCLPEQVVWTMRNSPPAERAPIATTAIPSMSRSLLVKAARIATTVMARQAAKPKTASTSVPYA
jgi:pyroglutamyl-peptidase